MTPRDLKKLVKLCRDMGISHYKGEGFEFTLTVDAPEPKKTKAAQATAMSVDNGDASIESDLLSPEQLLWWSAGTNELQEESSS